MKKWRSLFQRIFIRHVAAFEEEMFPCSRHQPPAFASTVLSSLQRHFCSAPSGQAYLLGYLPQYEAIVTELRHEGWVIRLEVDADGMLTYHIFSKHSGSPCKDSV